MLSHIPRRAIYLDNPLAIGTKVRCTNEVQSEYVVEGDTGTIMGYWTLDYPGVEYDPSRAEDVSYPYYVRIDGKPNEFHPDGYRLMGEHEFDAAKASTIAA